MKVVYVVRFVDVKSGNERLCGYRFVRMAGAMNVIVIEQREKRRAVARQRGSYEDHCRYGLGRSFPYCEDKLGCTRSDGLVRDDLAPWLITMQMDG